jgi:predicted dehydrogenase
LSESRREERLNTVRWGILGTGRIAGDFAAALSVLPGADLAAVGSRAPDAAAAFAGRVGATRAHGSYEALAADPDVEIVYIATPHALHHTNARLCLEHGKAVLCEKPFALNSDQARELVSLARERQLFLMEAMWTRFLPALIAAQRRIADGTIGEVRFLMADFGFNKPFDQGHRLFNITLGGGALLDVGVYLASLASLVFGPPASVASQARIGQSGVDEDCALLFGYDGGRFAQLTASIATTTPQEATIVGTIRMAPIARPVVESRSLHGRGEWPRRRDGRGPLSRKRIHPRGDRGDGTPALWCAGKRAHAPRRNGGHPGHT